MKKKSINILLIIVALVTICIGYKSLKIIFISSEDKIVIKTKRKTKTYLLTNEEQKKLQFYINELEQSPAYVDLALFNDMEITYNDYRIIMQNEVFDYCEYYKFNKDSKTAKSISYMPKGLYNLVMKKVNNK